MKEYLLTVRFPIKAIDNFEARTLMFELLKKHNLKKDQVKLQEIRKDGPPGHVPI
jgi:hypothetical protein